MAKHQRSQQRRNQTSEETKLAYDNGATRTSCLEYELIPQAAIEGLARRLTFGALKHGRNNWKKGGPEFVEATKGHLVKHLFQYLETGDQADLDAIGANYAVLEYYYTKGIK